MKNNLRQYVWQILNQSDWSNFSQSLSDGLALFRTLLNYFSTLVHNLQTHYLHFDILMNLKKAIDPSSAVSIGNWFQSYSEIRSATKLLTSQPKIKII